MLEVVDKHLDTIEEDTPKDEILNITKKHLFEVIEFRKSLLEKKLEEKKKIEESIKELTSEKLKYNGRIRFDQDIQVSLGMGYMGIFKVEDKEFDIVNGFIKLKGCEQGPCKDCERNIETEFYFEELLNYGEILE